MPAWLLRACSHSSATLAALGLFCSVERRLLPHTYLSISKAYDPFESLHYFNRFSSVNRVRICDLPPVSPALEFQKQ